MDGKVGERTGVGESRIVGAARRTPARRWARILTLAFLVGSAASAAAHPHQFIDYSVRVLLGRDSLKALRFEWCVLRDYARNLAVGYDKNLDGRLDEGEAAALYESDFLAFARNGFHFRLKCGEAWYAAGAVEDFSAELGLDEVRLSFTIPCVVAVGAGGTETEFAFVDETLFTSFDLRGLSIESPEGLACRAVYLSDPSVFSHGQDRQGVRVVLRLGSAGSDPASVQARSCPSSPALLPLASPPSAQASVNPFLGP